MSLGSIVADACQSYGYVLAAFEKWTLREWQAIVNDDEFDDDLPDCVQKMSPYVRRELFYYIHTRHGRR